MSSKHTIRARRIILKIYLTVATRNTDKNNMRWVLEWDRAHDKAYNEACSTTGITIVNIDIS